MFATELTLYRFNLYYCRASVADIPDEKLTQPLAPGTNNPYWILGPLAIATDYAANLLGLPCDCPPEWHRDFGPGSKPSASPAVRIPTADLLAAIESSHQRVAVAAANADRTAMARPHTVEMLKDTPIKTVGELVAHMMTTHPATHLGQLSMRRRVMGHPPLL